MKSRAITAMLVASAVGLAGCAPAAESAEATPEPTASATPSPTPAPPTRLELAAARVAQMTPAQQAALVVMGTAPGQDAAGLADYVESGPGGLILMGGNVPESSERLRALTGAVRAADPDALIATDQEGGDVRRLRGDDLPSARTLKNAPPADTRTAFAYRARMLADAGIDINFGVVADVPRTDRSFIFRRAYGTDPEKVAARVAEAVAAERGVVASTLKHFPGHGAAEGDSHHGIPTTDMPLERWRESDALPFQAGIDAGAELVMTGHLRFTAVSDAPASLSPEWYAILRDEMGFDGVAITDDLGMLSSSGEAAYADPVTDAVIAIDAGADMVLIIAGSTPATAGQVIDALTARATEDPGFAARLAEAATRVLRLVELTRR